MNKNIFLTVVFLSVVLFCITEVGATNFNALMDGYLKKEFWDNGTGPGAEIDSSSSKTDLGFFYDVPDVEAFSHMFWKIGLFDSTDDEALDEFIRINECDIYQKFFGNEFEWKKVRAASRAFLKKNKDDFPTRFEFEIPIKLQNYSEKYKVFNLQDGYKIKSQRRFELYATGADLAGCARDFKTKHGYPRILYMEFSRPFTLESIPVERQQAVDYVEQKNQEFIRRFSTSKRTDDRKYSLRSAYLFIRVKVYSAGEVTPASMENPYPAAQVFGVLEGYSIYTDRNKETLFYEQNFIRDKTSGLLNTRLSDQYKALKEKSKSGGILQ